MKGLLTCAKLSPVGDSVDHKPRWNSDLQTSWATRVCSLRDSLARELSKRAGKKDITLGGGRVADNNELLVVRATSPMVVVLLSTFRQPSWRSVTSIADQGVRASMHAVDDALRRAFASVFSSL